MRIGSLNRKPLALALGVLALSFVVLSVARAQSPASYSLGQSVADALREHAEADGAFVPAGLLQTPRGDLASAIKDTTEELVVVTLSGADVRQAFERALQSYPAESNAFLHISGFEVTFSRSAEAGKRVTAITHNGSRVGDGGSYTVAMPASLGRGGFGYFRIWDKAKITRKFDGVLLTTILKGKRSSESSPRWSPQ